MNDKTVFNKLFDSRNITSCYSIQFVIHIPTFRIVNLLCFGGYFSTMTILGVMNKYRSPYPLDVSFPYL